MKSVLTALLLCSPLALACDPVVGPGLCPPDADVRGAWYRDTISLLCHYTDNQLITVQMELRSPENTLTDAERCRLARCVLSTADYCE